MFLGGNRRVWKAGGDGRQRASTSQRVRALPLRWATTMGVYQVLSEGKCCGSQLSAHSSAVLAGGGSMVSGFVERSYSKLKQLSFRCVF